MSTLPLAVWIWGGGGKAVEGGKNTKHHLLPRCPSGLTPRPPPPADWPWGDFVGGAEEVRRAPRYVYTIVQMGPDGGGLRLGMGNLWSPMVRRRYHRSLSEGGQYIRIGILEGKAQGCGKTGDENRKTGVKIRPQGSPIDSGERHDAQILTGIAESEGEQRVSQIRSHLMHILSWYVRHLWS